MLWPSLTRMGLDGEYAEAYAFMTAHQDQPRLIQRLSSRVMTTSIALHGSLED
jgi:hypothetical protein